MKNLVTILSLHLVMAANMKAGTLCTKIVGLEVPEQETLEKMEGAWAFQLRAHDLIIHIMEIRVLDEENGEVLCILHNGIKYEEDREGHRAFLRTGLGDDLFLSIPSEDKRGEYKGYIVSSFQFIDRDHLKTSSASKEDLKIAVVSERVAGKVLVVKDDDTYGGYETIRVDENSEKVMTLISNGGFRIFDKPLSDIDIYRIKMNESNLIEPVVPYNSGQSLRD